MIRPPRRAAAILGLLVASVALAAAFPAVVRIPPPKNASAPQPLPWALFSHRAHETFGCYACHPSLFPQKLVGFTHEEMRQGQFCGHCHDGQIAFAIPAATCGLCHIDAH